MIKKPLVLANGEIEQLQSGDKLSPIPNVLSLENGESFDVLIGQPVVIESADTINYAIATTLPNVIGLASQAIVSGATGDVQTDGKLSATTAEWDLLTGQTGGLSPGAIYYLSNLDTGKLLIVPPETQGHYLVRLGIAINSTDFEIKISRPIKL